MIRNVWTIARRDFRAYFTSPIAYIVIAAFMFIMGWMFFSIMDHFLMESMRFQQMNPKGMSLDEGIIRPLYGNMNIIFLMLLPFVTMRLFAEERKQHTIELLLTSPVSLWQLVLGKFLSSVLLLAIMLGLTLAYPLFLAIYGNPDMGAVSAAFLGTFLLGCCYLALGVLCSSVTENQIVAGALTFASGLFFLVISWASFRAGPVWSDVFTYLSVVSHFTNFLQGMINTSDLVYYVSFIGIGLFLTHRVLDSYRWR